LIKNSGVIKSPTILVGYSLLIKNSGVIKSPTILVGQINPTNLVGFKKNLQKFPKKETLPF
jgi:hypothetical protein